MYFQRRVKKSREERDRSPSLLTEHCARVRLGYSPKAAAKGEGAAAAACGPVDRVAPCRRRYRHIPPLQRWSRPLSVTSRLQYAPPRGRSARESF